MIHKIQYLRKLIPIGMPTSYIWNTTTRVNVNPNTVIDPRTGQPIATINDREETAPPPPPTPTAPTPSNPTPITVDTSTNVFDPIVDAFNTYFKSAGSHTMINLPPFCTDVDKTNALNECQLAYETQNTKIVAATNLTRLGKQAILIALQDFRTAAEGKIRDIQANNNRYINGIIAANQTAIDARQQLSLANVTSIAQQRIDAAILAEKTALFNKIVQYGETISKLDIQNPSTKGRNIVNGLNYISNNKSVHARDGAGNIIVTKE